MNSEYWVCIKIWRSYKCHIIFRKKPLDCFLFSLKTYYVSSSHVVNSWQFRTFLGSWYQNPIFIGVFKYWPPGCTDSAISAPRFRNNLDVHSSLCWWECRIRKILLRAANADTKCDVEMCEDIFDPVIKIRYTSGCSLSLFISRYMK